MDPLTLYKILIQISTGSIDKKVDPSPKERISLCEKSLNKILDTRQYNVDYSCFEELKKSPSTHFMENNDLQVIGHKSFLLIKGKNNYSERVRIISGESSKIRSINQITIGKNLPYVIVIEDDKLLVFSVQDEGDVSPINVINLEKSTKIEKARFDEKNLTLIVSTVHGDKVFNIIPQKEPFK